MFTVLTTTPEGRSQTTSRSVRCTPRAKHLVPVEQEVVRSQSSRSEQENIPLLLPRIEPHDSRIVQTVAYSLYKMCQGKPARVDSVAPF
jgi:hypothetical protein